MTNQINNPELEIGTQIAKGKEGSLSEKEREEIRLEVINGNLLGDGSLRTYAVLSEPTGFAMQMTSNRRQYIEHLYNVYTPWVTAKIYDKKKGRKNKAGEDAKPNWAFDTKVRKELLPYRNWRDTSSKPVRKKLPPNVEELMTPRAIAYWFMDDGALANGSRTNKGFYLCTDGFKKEETLLLIDILKTKYNINCNETFTYEKRWRIYITRASYNDFVEIVKPYIIPCFMYKINS